MISKYENKIKKKKKKKYMKTKFVAFIAGIIWFFVGFNVCRSDIHLYPSLP